MESRSSEHALTLPLVSKTEENATLPLVINVVAKYWGEDLYPAAANAQPLARGGSVIIYGLELAERKGFSSYIYRGSAKDLKKRVDQGIPPIVIMPGIRGIIQHALVVCGYDEDERRMLTYVAEPDAIGAIPESKFEDDWRQDDMTTIIVVPSDMEALFLEENLQFRQSNRLAFEAEGLRQQSNVDGAIEKLRLATQIDQDNAQAWCLLGGIYNELSNEQALACYQMAVKLNPRYYIAHKGMGNYFLKKNEFSMSETCYTSAIRINPRRFGPIYKNRAIARIHLGDKPGAKQDLGAYLQLMLDAEDRESIEKALSEL